MADRDEPIDPHEDKAAEIIQLHEAKMRYAWNWFQYHADQRLKGFNFFVLAIGVLFAGYGAAIKESISIRPTSAPLAGLYEWFAVFIACCGVLISIGFWLIEIRNVELVNCGRTWLAKLERQLVMPLRDSDRGRSEFRGALPFNIPDCWEAPLKRITKHEVVFRAFYIVAIVTFVIAAVLAVRGFH